MKDKKKQMIIDMIEANYEFDLILKTTNLSLTQFLTDYGDSFDKQVLEIVEKDWSSAKTADCFDNVAVYCIVLKTYKFYDFVFDGFTHRHIKTVDILDEMKNCERYYISVLRDNKIDEILE